MQTLNCADFIYVIAFFSLDLNETLIVLTFKSDEIDAGTLTLYNS